MKEGDIITITEEGVDFMRNARIPHTSRAIYGIIHNEGGILRKIEGDTAWVEISDKKFPHYDQVGVQVEYLKER